MRDSYTKSRIGLLYILVLLGLFFTLSVEAKKASSDKQSTNKKTMEDHLTFFKEQISKFSPDHVLDLKWNRAIGMHTVATREISVSEPVLEIPCNWVIGVYDNFEFKQELYEALQKVKF